MSFVMSRTFSDVLSPATIWQDDSGTVWISMSDIDSNEILSVESIDKLIQALVRARFAINSEIAWERMIEERERIMEERKR